MHGLALSPRTSPLPRQAAYRENTLGLPKTCPAASVEHITRRHLHSYLSGHMTPRKMVVAGVGVKHQRLVDAVQRWDRALCWS